MNIHESRCSPPKQRSSNIIDLTEEEVRIGSLTQGKLSPSPISPTPSSGNPEDKCLGACVLRKKMLPSLPSSISLSPLPTRHRQDPTADRLDLSIGVQLGVLKEHVLSLQRAETILRDQEAVEQRIKRLQEENQQLRDQILDQETKNEGLRNEMSSQMKDNEQLQNRVSCLQNRNDFIHKQHYQQQIQIAVLLESEKEFTDHIKRLASHIADLERQSVDTARLSVDNTALKLRLEHWKGVATRMSTLSDEISSLPQGITLPFPDALARSTKRKAEDGIVSEQNPPRSATPAQTPPSPLRSILKRKFSGPRNVRFSGHVEVEDPARCFARSSASICWPSASTVPGSRGDAKGGMSWEEVC